MTDLAAIMAEVRDRLARPAPVNPAVLDALTEHGKHIGKIRQAVGCLAKIVAGVILALAGITLYLAFS